ncbi:hypothetical protein EH11_03932 [Bacillus subtilis]|nr:hypothetical protein EH11_03932 [Bacillus subtilis]RPK08003.1 hypothetical protein EH5_04098 [Bacillus subtilis]RUS03946.1 hypothetical protein EFW59_03937 [Bacillus subtilis]
MAVSVKSGKAKDLAVIDPHEASLENWKRNPSYFLMRYLRFPSVQQRKWSNCPMKLLFSDCRQGFAMGKKD